MPTIITRGMSTAKAYGFSLGSIGGNYYFITVVYRSAGYSPASTNINGQGSISCWFQYITNNRLVLDKFGNYFSQNNPSNLALSGYTNCNLTNDSNGYTYCAFSNFVVQYDTSYTKLLAKNFECAGMVVSPSAYAPGAVSNINNDIFIGVSATTNSTINYQAAIAKYNFYTSAASGFFIPLSAGKLVYSDPPRFICTNNTYSSSLVYLMCIPDVGYTSFSYAVHSTNLTNPNVSNSLNWRMYFQPTSGSIRISAIARDNSGNVFVPVYKGSTNTNEIKIYKFSNQGAIDISFGTSGVISLNIAGSGVSIYEGQDNIITDQSGNIYYGFSTKDVSSNPYKTYIVKLNSSGSIVWTRVIQTTNGNSNLLQMILTDNEQSLLFQVREGTAQTTGLVIKIPTDGTLTQSFVWNGITVNYATTTDITIIAGTNFVTPVGNYAITYPLVTPTAVNNTVTESTNTSITVYKQPLN